MKLAEFAFVSLGLAGLGSCSEGADLTTVQVSTVITAAGPHLQECYQASLDRRPGAPAEPIQAQAALHVEASGSVAQVELELPTDEELTRCVKEVLKGLRFPEAEAPTHASLPLVFSAGAEGD